MEEEVCRNRDKRSNGVGDEWILSTSMEGLGGEEMLAMKGLLRVVEVCYKETWVLMKCSKKCVCRPLEKFVLET